MGQMLQKYKILCLKKGAIAYFRSFWGRPRIQRKCEGNGECCLYYKLQQCLCGDHLDVCLPLLLMLLLLSLLPGFVKQKKKKSRSGEIKLCNESKCLRWERSVLGGAPQSILGPAIKIYICSFISTSKLSFHTMVFSFLDSYSLCTYILYPCSIT